MEANVNGQVPTCQLQRPSHVSRSRVEASTCAGPRRWGSVTARVLLDRRGMLATLGGSCFALHALRLLAIDQRLSGELRIFGMDRERSSYEWLLGTALVMALGRMGGLSDSKLHCPRRSELHGGVRFFASCAVALLLELA